MRFNQWVILASCGLISTAIGRPSAAQTSAGQAAPYLRSGAGARMLAMGNAGTAAAADAAAAYWNPAALVKLHGWALDTQTALLGQDRSWNYLGLAYGAHSPRARPYAYALSWMNFSGGSALEARSANRPEPERLFSDAQNAFWLSGAAGISPDFFLGANLTFLLHTLDNETANGWGGDLAAWHRLMPEITWGVKVQELFASLDWSGRHTDRLPVRLRAGCAWTPDEHVTFTLEPVAEYWPDSGTWHNLELHAGFESQWWRALSVRLGWDAGRFTGGAGWKFSLGPQVGGRLDYALAGEVLPGEGVMQMFSLGVDFYHE